MAKGTLVSRHNFRNITTASTSWAAMVTLDTQMHDVNHWQFADANKSPLMAVIMLLSTTRRMEPVIGPGALVVASVTANADNW